MGFLGCAYGLCLPGVGTLTMNPLVTSHAFQVACDPCKLDADGKFPDEKDGMEEGKFYLKIYVCYPIRLVSVMSLLDGESIMDDVST
jgi:hypothetical protein